MTRRTFTNCCTWDWSEGLFGSHENLPKQGTFPKDAASRNRYKRRTCIYQYPFLEGCLIFKNQPTSKTLGRNGRFSRPTTSSHRGNIMRRHNFLSAWQEWKAEKKDRELQKTGFAQINHSMVLHCLLNHLNLLTNIFHLYL